MKKSPDLIQIAFRGGKTMFGIMDFVIALAFMLIAIGVAVLRGTSRSVFRVILVGVSFVGALVTALVVKSSAASEQTIAQLAELAGADVSALLAQIGEYSPSLVKILVGSTVSFLTPLIFFVVFIALLIATWVLYFVVSLILFPLFHKKEKNISSRRVKSLIVGAAQGVFVLFLLVSPISYYGTVIDDAVPALEKNGIIEEIAKTTDMSADDIKATLDSGIASPLMKVNSTLGGKAFCGALTNFSFEDTNGDKVKVNLADELDPIVAIAGNVMKLGSTPMAEFGESEAKAIENIGNAFSESPLMKTVSSELIGGVTEAWKNGDSFASIEKPQVGDMADGIFNNLIVIFNKSSKNSDNLGTDINDISKIVAVMVKADIMKDMNDPTALLEKLSSSNAINDVTAILRSNERLRPIISDITTLSIYVLADTMGVPATKEEVYLNMLNDVSTKLNETKDLDAPERIAILKPFIKNELDMLGAPVSEEYVASVCQALVTDFGDVDAVTPEFIAEFFAVYEQNRGEVGGTTEVADKFGDSIVKLDGRDGYTFHKYQTQESREKSGAAIIGKLDAKIIEISGKEDTAENKRAEIDQAVAELMAPIFTEIIEKSQDKEKAETVIQEYSQTVGNLSEKEQGKNIESSNNLASFAASTTAKVNCMTLTDIKDKFAASAEVTDEAEAEKHSQIINTVVECASSLLAATKKDEAPDGGTGDGTGDNVGGETGGDNVGGETGGEQQPSKDNTVDILKAATEGLGTILDTLAETNLYGKDDTANLMQSILTSDTVSQVIPLTKEEAGSIIDKVKNDENVSYGSLMLGVSGAAELIISMTEGKCTEEGVKNLILGINETNIDAILVIVSEKRFELLGIKGDKIAPTYAIMKTLLTELAKVTEENADIEAKAVKKLIDVALSAKTTGNGLLFGENGKLGDAKVFIDEVLASEAVCNTIITTEHDPFGIVDLIPEADKEAFKTACESYNGTEDEATVKAIAAVLGIVID